MKARLRETLASIMGIVSGICSGLMTWKIFARLGHSFTARLVSGSKTRLELDTPTDVGFFVIFGELPLY